jgi:hypothetical protein
MQKLGEALLALRDERAAKRKIDVREIVANRRSACKIFAQRVPARRYERREACRARRTQADR